jgi:hypothetical protein
MTARRTSREASGTARRIDRHCTYASAVRWLLPFGIAIALASVPAARANADPASDVLITQNVFFPYQGVSESLGRELTKLTGRAEDAGYPIKVALIASPDDLGLVTSLWEKPKMYAPFLGRELLFVYRHTLVVVMPNGFGVYRDNQDVTREEQLLSRIRIASGTDGLARAAIFAVRRLAAASGHPIRPGGGWLTLDRILIGVGALVVIAVLVFVGGMRRRSKLSPKEQEDDQPGGPAQGEGDERGAEA